METSSKNYIMSLGQLRIQTKIIAVLLTLAAVFVAWSLVESAGKTVVVNNESFMSILPVAHAAGAVVDGSCGSSDGATVSSAPSGSGACSAGSRSGMTYNAASPAGWTWTCSGTGGGVDSLALTGNGVTTPPPPPPSVSLSASPASISAGDSTAINWSVSGNVTSCTASLGWSGSKNISSGSESSSPTSNTSYRLTCSGAGGSSVQTVNVTVSNPAPVISAGSNQTITLPQQSTNPSGATASDPNTPLSYLWTRTGAPAGAPSASITNSNTLNPTFNNMTVSGTYTYNLRVTDSFGAISNDTTEVFVAPAPTYICTGSPVSNSAYYSGDNTGLTANTPAVYRSSNTAAKCEYRCNTAYWWNGAACVLPDLTATVPSPVSGSYMPNDSINFTGRVVNSATAPVAQAGWADVQIDWSPNDAGPYVNYNAKGGVRVGSLPQSGTSNLSYVMPSNSGMPAGTHRYRFHVDTDGTGVVESNESNNYSSWNSFVINPIPAACGTANGQSFNSAPSSNLCGSGSPSAVSGAGPWNWTCVEAGTPDASCSADINPPAVPTGLSASPSSCSTGIINLSWNSAARAQTYTIERDGSVITTISGTTYTDSGLGDGSTHTYRVRSNNSGGSQNSAYGSAVTATTEIDCTTLNYPDLTADSVTLNLGTPNGVNGNYTNTRTQLTIGNLGPHSPLLAGSSTPYMSTIDFDNDSSIDRVSSIDYESGVIAVNDTSGSITQILGTVNFGSHEVCLRVNLDGTTITESSSNTTNNVRCVSVNVAVPQPPISITSNKQLIRSGESVDITWSALTNYPTLNCSVYGPGGFNLDPDANNFSANSAYPSAYTRTKTVANLKNTSEFIIQCNETKTNTTFVESLTVEVVPEVQEF